MSAYTDAAPMLSTAVGVTKFKADHPRPPIVAPVEDSPPSKVAVTAIYTALLTMEAQGIGYSGVARMTGVSVSWVRAIHAEMGAAKGAVWAPVVID